MAGCIAETKRWMTANKLKLNESKTEALIVHAGSTRMKPLVLARKQSNLHRLPEIWGSSQTLDDHVRSICQKAFFHLHRISRIRKYLTQSGIRQLVHAFITSQLDYGNSLYGWNVYRGSKMQPLDQPLGPENSTRLTTSLPTQALHCLFVRQSIEFKRAMLTFRSLNGSAPKYLSDLIELYRPARSSNSLDLVVPTTRLKAYDDRSFKKIAPLVWNSLPLSIRRSKSLS